MLDDMLLDLYAFRLKHLVWNDPEQLWRKWIRDV